MGQAQCIKSRSSGSSSTSPSTSCSTSPSEAPSHLRKNTYLAIPQHRKTFKPTKMTPSLRRVQAHEDITMGGVQIESQQPAPARGQRRPRVIGSLSKPVRARSVIKEILLENRNNSYIFDSKTVEQQARAVETFVGDAHYYNLTSKKVSKQARRTMKMTRSNSNLGPCYYSWYLRYRVCSTRHRREG